MDWEYKLIIDIPSTNAKNILSFPNFGITVTWGYDIIWRKSQINCWRDDCLCLNWRQCDSKLLGLFSPHYALLLRNNKITTITIPTTANGRYETGEIGSVITYDGVGSGVGFDVSLTFCSSAILTA